MSNKKERPNIEDHFELADLIYNIQDNHSQLHDKCTKHYPLNHKVIRELDKIYKSLFEIKNILDDEYSRTATEDELKKYSFIYYNGKSPKK